MYCMNPPSELDQLLETLLLCSSVTFYFQFELYLLLKGTSQYENLTWHKKWTCMMRDNFTISLSKLHFPFCFRALSFGGGCHCVLPYILTCSHVFFTDHSTLIGFFCYYREESLATAIPSIFSLSAKRQYRLNKSMCLILTGTLPDCLIKGKAYLNIHSMLIFPKFNHIWLVHIYSIMLIRKLYQTSVTVFHLNIFCKHMVLLLFANWLTTGY
jgi:hypothetical protein